VEGRLGEYVIFDGAVARILGVDPDDDRWDEEVLLAFGIDDLRNVEVESGYSIDQLENIAWASGTSAFQSPNTAAIAIRALRDLIGRWLIAGERDRSDRADEQETLPVVYLDGAVQRVIDALASLVIGAAESRQAQTCAELIDGFAGVARRLRNDQDRRAFDLALDNALPAVVEQAEVPRLRAALDLLEQTLDAVDRGPDRVRDVGESLRDATRRRVPKPSDEPEAARPPG
jgi:Predicted membrane protein (DUF2254)